MSTRKLILASLLCGLVILMAGGIKLLQVAGEGPRVSVLAVGDEALVGDMSARVVRVDRTASATVVSVELVGVETPDAAVGWVMLGDGRRREPQVGCGATLVAEVHRCELVFDPVERLQAIAYARGGEQRQWGP